MTQEYDNDLRGVLFKNDRKESDRHPDYKGSAEVDGVEYWIAAWIKEGKKGKFMSLSFTEKEDANPPAREPVKQTRAQQRGGFDEAEDDPIPF
jgi:predicted DNA-binding WGR domain protein